LAAAANRVKPAMKDLKMRKWILAVVAGSIALAGAAHADSDGHDARKAKDHEIARQAMLRHEVLPLKRVLALAEQYQQGDVIEVEFKSKSGRLVYEVEILTRSGVVRELKIDARSGKLLVNEPKGK
jgi:uncharacterized membrane protein YkoI